MTAGTTRQAHRSAARVELGPDDAGRGLAGLVLAVVEVLRQLLERQAIRRMDAGSLSDAEVERVGLTLMRLEENIRQLAQDCGVDAAEVDRLADRVLPEPVTDSALRKEVSQP